MSGKRRKPDPQQLAATHCFGCSPNNDAGLKLDVELTDQGAIARWTPDERFRGYNNISHGGIVATVLDEMMGWAILSVGAPPHATTKLEVEYRAPHWIDREYECESTIAEQRSRALIITAEIRDVESGKVTARGTSTFVKLPEDRVAEFTGRS